MSGLTTPNCPAYILAGGQSNRFGSDKSRVLVNGKVQICQLAATLSHQGHEVIVVAGEHDHFGDLEFLRDLPSRVIFDRQPGLGPMMGVATALADRLQYHERVDNPDNKPNDSETPSPDGWLLALTVDQFLWKADWFECLAEEVQGTVEAATFRFDANEDKSKPSHWKIQSLPGLYHVCLLPLLEQSVARGQLALRSILGEVNVASISHTDNPSNWSFNDQATLERLIRMSTSS